MSARTLVACAGLLEVQTGLVRAPVATTTRQSLPEHTAHIASFCSGLKLSRPMSPSADTSCSSLGCILRCHELPKGYCNASDSKLRITLVVSWRRRCSGSRTDNAETRSKAMFSRIVALHMTEPRMPRNKARTGPS